MRKLYKLMSKYEIDIDEDVYFYGISLIRRYFIFFIVVFSIIYFIGITEASIIFSITYFFIRHFSGGLHFKSEIMCTGTSILVIFVAPFLIWDKTLDYYIILLLYIIFILVTSCTNTVDHPNKPLTLNDDKYFKRKTIKTIIICFIISITLKSYNLDMHVTNITGAIALCCIERIVGNIIKIMYNLENDGG